jgi:uncharacterized protein (DUF983 family)
MSTENAIFVDFWHDPKQPRRKLLYFKRPKGTPIPVGVKWRCVCGEVYVMTAEPKMFCQKCGSRLQHQENKEEASLYFSCIEVHHFNLRR